MGISTKDWYCVLFPHCDQKSKIYSVVCTAHFMKFYLSQRLIKEILASNCIVKWRDLLTFFGHSVVVTGPLKVMPPISKPLLLLGSPPIPPLLLPYLFGHISQKVHNLFAPSYRNANPKSATDCEIFRGPPPFRTFQFFVSQILNFARGQWLDDSSIMEISSKQFLSAKVYLRQQCLYQVSLSILFAINTPIVFVQRIISILTKTFLSVLAPF